MSYQEFKIPVNTTNDEKVVHVNLKQGVDVMKILSLEITSEDTYQLHTSGYGVIVGRVLANEAYGVPNVRVSVFVPLSSEDKENDAISTEYPYATLQTRNDDGKKYNILPDSANGGYDGKHTAMGSFPNKNEVLDNDTQREIFDKYWKFSTVTNESGDYMLFGVPTGVTQVHIDCDISDIGLLSQRPYDLVAKGYDASQFKSMTEFKTDSMENAPQIMSQDKTITVFPFWGDNKENRIGITRCDVKLDYDFTPSCIFLGSCITDSPGGYINTEGEANGSSGDFNSLRTSIGDIEVIRQTENGTIEELKDNVKGIIDGDGVWCYQIPMNLDRIGMDEEGNIVQVNVPGKGIPTRARVRFRISLNTGNEAVTTCKMLVPNNPKLNHNVNFPENVQTADEWEHWYEFGKDTPDCCFRDLHWNKVYSIKQYYPRIQSGPIDPVPTGQNYHGETYFADKDYYCNAQPDYRQFPLNYANPFNCIHSICPSNFVNAFPYNTMYAGAEHRYRDGDYDTTNLWFQQQLTAESKSTLREKGLLFCLENDWINGCLYFPNVSLIKVGNKVQCCSQPNKKLYITGRHCLTYANNEYQTGIKYYNKWSGEITESDINDAWRELCGLNNGLRGTSGDNIAERIYKFNQEHQLKVGENAVLSIKTLRNTIDAAWLLEGLISDNNGPNNVSIEKNSRFSQVKLQSGIIHPFINNENQYIFYYSSGDELGRGYQRLYATDIINIGNLNDTTDCLPHLYEKLPNTSFTLPPMVASYDLNESGMNMDGSRLIAETQWGKKVDVDNVDLFGNYEGKYSTDREVEQNIKLKYEEGFLKSCLKSYGASAGITAAAVTKDNYAEVIKFAQERYTLFFGQRSKEVPNYLHYLPTTFVNTSRICELGVANDHLIEGRPAPKSVYRKEYYPINGMIDRFDIVDDTIRSEFASLNYDVEKYTYNPSDKRKCFVPTPMYVVDFDGRLKNYVHARNFFNIDERKDESYVKFRYGDIGNGPVRYYPTYFSDSDFPEYKDKDINKIFANRINSQMILTENSFYFYFGLNYGHTALDKLRKNYSDYKSVQEYSESTYETANEGVTHELWLYFIPTSLHLTFTIDGTKGKFKDTDSFKVNGVDTRNYEIRRIDNNYLVASGTTTRIETSEFNGFKIENIWTLHSMDDINTMGEFYGKRLTFSIDYEKKQAWDAATNQQVTQITQYSYPFVFIHSGINEEIFNGTQG